MEPEDSKGGKVSWSKVEEMIDEIGNTWGIQAGERRIGDLRTSEKFNEELGKVWLEWENKQMLGGQLCARGKKRLGGG